MDTTQAGCACSPHTLSSTSFVATDASTSDLSDDPAPGNMVERNAVNFSKSSEDKRGKFSHDTIARDQLRQAHGFRPDYLTVRYASTTPRMTRSARPGKAPHPSIARAHSGDSGR